MTRARRSGLGKGLDALFMDNDTNDTGVVTLRLSQIEPNREQPRKAVSYTHLTLPTNSLV